MYRAMRRGVVGWAMVVLANVAAWGEQPAAPVAAPLPPTAVALLEVPDPAALLATLLEHPIRAKIEASPAYQQALQGGQLIPLKAGLAVIEFGMQMSWQETLSAITGGGLCIAIDGPSQGAALLAKARDAETLAKFRNVVLNLVRDDAKRKEKPDPIGEISYRGITTYHAGPVRFAVVDDLLIVTNKGALGKAILDRLLDQAPGGLSTTPRYQEARAFHSADVAAWGYLDVEVLRQSIQEPDHPLVTGRAKNPAAEILIGGLLANLHQTPFVTAAVELNGERLRLVAQSPHDASWGGEEREYFFGPQAAGEAPRPLNLPRRIATLCAYRDFSDMWLRAGDLFSREINDKFAEADANLTTLFSNKDFGEEILGALEPQVQVIVVRQEFAEEGPVPAIKLPAFALISVLKEPDVMQRDFRRTFQNLVGFLNVVGAMNGQPQLDVERESHAGGTLVTSTYVPDADPRPGTESRIHYNFSPTIGFVGPHFIVASTAPLARSLVEQLANPPTDTSSAGSQANTHVQLDAAALRDVLHDNFGQLVAQNVLEKGHSREQAEQEIRGFLEFLTLFRSFQVRFEVGERLSVIAELAFASD